MATGLSDVVGGAACDCVIPVLSFGAVSGTLRSVVLGCTLETVAFLFCLGTLGSVPCIDVASTSRVRLQISCFCCAVTNGLLFRTLARSDMAFIILLACNRDGFVMFFVLELHCV